MSGIDIEGTLSSHTYVTFGYCAGCAWTPPDQADTAEPYPDQHRAHVAAVLRAQIEGALAEAWDEGNLSGGYWGTTQAYPADVDPPSDNPYRAAHLSDTERAGGAG